MRVPLLCLIFIAGLLRTAGASEAPAGLVMAVSGVVAPPLAPMSEIPSGQQIKLAPDAELTLLDYARCKMTRVSGGTLMLTRSDFVADGRVLSQVEAACPRVHRLGAGAAGSVAGGLVMRGVGSVPKWPLNHELVIAGDAAAKLKTAEIFAADKLDAPVLAFDVTGQSARYPAAARQLPVNERYVLRLTLADRPEPIDISFIGAEPSGPSLVIVLRGP